MQPVINAPEIATAREQQLFNGKNFHVFIYNKTESISGLHQHDYYEFTLVLTGRYFQEINGKRVLLERGDFVFIPLGSHHQSFYEFGATRILNVGISKRFLSSITCHCCLIALSLRRYTGPITLFSPMWKQ
ncbi:chb operon repressor [Escherichia coli]|uniref:Chb operon repressor n=1 Tax=Escherichia coli TaxID=562 RepID=A0A2X1NCI0_ECOLX|nr:chb operon repressor [Escherichia coli]